MGLPQLLSPSKLSAAQASIQAGGDGVRDGVAMILVAVAEYTDSQGADGVNGGTALAAAMRRLTEDPYLTLGVDPSADEGTIKKAYRKLALRYHPDKNKATSTLFQAVQGAHDILIEPDKRAEYDVKRKRQQEALNRLRKHPKGAAAGTPANNTASSANSTSGGTKQASSPYAGAGGNQAAPGSTAGAGGARSSKKASPAKGKGAAREPAAASGDEKVRQFNKRFYEEFRREAQKQDKSKATSTRSSGPSPAASKHQPPSRPKMRSTNRTDTTVTLEWHCGGMPSTTAFELQWRQRGRSASEWVTSPTLIVGNSCRKKNLTACTCYEFRVRAASAWGWSGHCDPVMVVTLPSAAGAAATGADGGGGEGTSASPRQKVSGFQSDGIGGSAAEKAKAQVEEARRRRSQSQASHTKPSVQFRSSSIAGNDGAEGGQKDPSSNSTAARQRGGGGAGGGGGGGVDSTGASGGAGGGGMEKTNSWYWRRMSRAAAQNGKEGANAEGTGNEKAQRRRTMQEQGTPSQGAWLCVVCKRSNEPTSNSCWVCYTARSYQPVNLDRIRTENETSGGGVGGKPLNSARRSSISSRSRSRSANPADDATSGDKQGESGSATAANKDGATEPGIGASDKVPSIRVYSVPDQESPGGARGGADGDGIRVSASEAQPTPDSASATSATGGKGGTKDPADVWEFTEGDLDNIGGAKTTYGSDDEWSYASGVDGLDTKSDPGDADRYRRRSSKGGGTQRRGSSQAGATTAASAARRGRHELDGDDDSDDEAPPKRYLNGRITKLHNVRAEPIRDAKVVGYLVATKEVQVLAEVGDWFKVRWHKRAKDKSQEESKPASSPAKAGDDKTPRTSGAAAAPSSATSTPRSSSSAVGEKAKGREGGGGGEEGSETGEAERVEDTSEDGTEKGTGWCVTRDKKHQYIITIGPDDAASDGNRRPSSAKSHRKRSSAGRRRSSVSAARTSGGLSGGGGASDTGTTAANVGGSGGDGAEFGEDGEEGECWHELKDEDGSVYYFNAATGMSQWEPPLWLDEIDPTTGAVYYVNSYTGDPQWERPEEFVPIVRENPYATTPEQDFIKSVLSPKRSKGAKSFHEAMYKAARTGGSAQHLNTVSEGVAGGGGAGDQPKDAAAA